MTKKKDEDPSKPSATERSMHGRIAAYSRWAKTEDRSAATAAGRKGLMDRFEREVDPEGVLAPDERARRVAAARKAYYTKLSLMAAKARRERRNK